MESKKIILISICGFIGVLLLIFLLELLNLGNFNFFGIRNENVKTKIYEHSQMYVEGKKMDLNKNMSEFKQSTNEISRLAIKNLTVQNFSEFNEDDPFYNLTNEEKEWLKDMKYGTNIDTLKYPYPQHHK